MKKVFISAILAAGLVSCVGDIDQTEVARNRAESVLGITLDANHTWCTATRGSISVKADAPADDIEKVQVFALVPETDDDGEKNLVLRKLNEAKCSKGMTVQMSYDIPDISEGVFASCVTRSGKMYIAKASNGKASFQDEKTRATIKGNTLPDEPVLGKGVESYANIRGYKGFEDEVLYSLSDADETLQEMSVPDYSEDFASAMRALVFTYLPNGRKYDNLPQVKKSGYYNESSYPITTGAEPIIVSPVYKNDGTSNEVVHSELYYYYFKESDVTGDEAQYIKSLPKYKVVDMARAMKNGRMPNDRLAKQTSYALIYWGEGTPVVGQSKGSYTFPAGYKIGFMVRSNVSEVKKGELYCDGRLNTDINKHGHFASSRLGSDPRMAWLTVNNKTILCCESGTDRDFNDIIFEIEGGVYVPIIIPEIESNFYTFCFEDQNYGDYDLNDVVLKGKRIDSEHVEYTLMACGASDNLYIKNIGGKTINDNAEVHALFGKNASEFVNTASVNAEYVVDTVKVDTSFSFLNAGTQPYVYDKDANTVIKVAVKGQDPHAIMIPYDFRWPRETVRINQAYPMFNNWGANALTNTDWYKHPVTDKVW